MEMIHPYGDGSAVRTKCPGKCPARNSQFQAISGMFDDIRGRLISLTPLGLTVSNPPTRTDAPAIADKQDEMINTLSA